MFRKLGMALFVELGMALSVELGMALFVELGMALSVELGMAQFVEPSKCQGPGCLTIGHDVPAMLHIDRSDLFRHTARRGL